MDSTELIIKQTENWVSKVVVGCNFCPFAARELKLRRIHYRVEYSEDSAICLEALLGECGRLDESRDIETILLILPNAVPAFDEFLDLLSVSEELLRIRGYEGIYQVASFHPLYQFEGTASDDAANFTNRSIYPMLQLLREESVEAVLENYADPGKIPERNIRFAREKGVAFMRMLRESCL